MQFCLMTRDCKCLTSLQVSFKILVQNTWQSNIKFHLESFGSKWKKKEKKKPNPKQNNNNIAS